MVGYAPVVFYADAAGLKRAAALNTQVAAAAVAVTVLLSQISCSTTNSLCILISGENLHLQPRLISSGNSKQDSMTSETVLQDRMC